MEARAYAPNGRVSKCAGRQAPVRQDGGPGRRHGEPCGWLGIGPGEAAVLGSLAQPRSGSVSRVLEGRMGGVGVSSKPTQVVLHANEQHHQSGLRFLRGGGPRMLGLGSRAVVQTSTQDVPAASSRAVCDVSVLHLLGAHSALCLSHGRGGSVLHLWL